MSGFFQKKYNNVSRMSLNTMLEMRDYFDDIIKPCNTELTDYFGNTNLLLPNPLSEKEDYGDMDIFLYTTEKSDKILQLLNHNGAIIDINKNDHIYSLYYLYKGLYYQVDLNIVYNYDNFVESIFNYYRVPYFMFLLGLLFFRLGLNIGIRGVYIKENIIGKEETYILVEKDIIYFIEKIFGFKKLDIYSIDGFGKLTNYINSTWLPDYNFIDTLKSEHKSKVLGNKFLQEMVQQLREPKYDVKEAKDFVYNEVYKYYGKEIETRRQDYSDEYYRKIEEVRELNVKLATIFNVKTLHDVPVEKKQNIGKIKKDLDYYYNLALEEGIYQ